MKLNLYTIPFKNSRYKIQIYIYEPANCAKYLVNDNNIFIYQRLGVIGGYLQKKEYHQKLIKIAPYGNQGAYFGVICNWQGDSVA